MICLAVSFCLCFAVSTGSLTGILLRAKITLSKTPLPLLCYILGARSYVGTTLLRGYVSPATPGPGSYGHQIHGLLLPPAHYMLFRTCTNRLAPDSTWVNKLAPDPYHSSHPKLSPFSKQIDFFVLPVASKQRVHGTLTEVPPRKGANNW